MYESSRTRRAVPMWLLTALLLLSGLAPLEAREAPQTTEPAAEGPVEAPPSEQEPEPPVAPEPEPEESIEPEGPSAADRLDERRYPITKDTQVHFMSDLVIAEGEAAREAVAILGDVEVRGVVWGDAVAVMGSVTVSGEVVGTVTAIGDDVRLEAGSKITGDVISVGGRVEQHPDARVLGDISEVDLGPAMRVSGAPFEWRYDEPHIWDMWRLGVAWELFWTLTKWILLLLITSFILLVARRPVERVRRVVEQEFWKAGLIGLATWLLLFPVLLVATIILAISIIGIPLLLILWPLAIFVLLVACFVGYTATAWALGGWLGRRFGRPLTNPYLALLLGVVVIQLLSFVAELLGGMGGPMWFFVLMFGLTGWFVRFVAWTVGLGGAMLAFAERGHHTPPPTPPPTPSPGWGAGPGGEVSPPGDAPVPETSPEPPTDSPYHSPPGAGFPEARPSGEPENAG